MELQPFTLPLILI